MDKDESKKHGGESIVVSWAIIGLICLWVFTWALFLYFTVGSKIRPGWDYKIISDVPSASENSTARARQTPGGGMMPAQGAVSGMAVEGQHVSGPETPFQEMIRREAMK